MLNRERPFMKILVAEDDYASALVLEKALRKAGYDVATARNGAVAQEMMKEEPFDLLLTDWMMPQLDGLELIRWARRDLNPVPPIAMLTVISNPEARAHAFLAGADEFIAKPYDIENLLSVVGNLIARSQQARPTAPPPMEPPAPKIAPTPGLKLPLGIVIGSGTGGPDLLLKLLPPLCKGVGDKAFVALVQQGPDWLLYDLVDRLQDENVYVELAHDGQEIETGKVYVAHGEKHMTLSDEPLKIRFNTDPPENFMRPSVDVTFRSAASLLGPRTLALVLSGIGCDGSLGAARVKERGGQVLVQDPEKAVADTMPRAVLDMEIGAQCADPDELASTIESTLQQMLGLD